MFIYILIAALIIFTIYILYNSAKTRSKIRDEKAEMNKKYNASISGSIQHFEGLPIPRGGFVNLYYGNDKITFVKEHQEISLDLSKIISMDIINGNDIQSQATGAVAGSLLLGGISGAVLGALISTKTYFIIVYKTDNENKSIVFDNSGGELSGDKLDVFKILNDFRSSHIKNIEKTEL